MSVCYGKISSGIFHAVPSKNGHLYPMNPCSNETGIHLCCWGSDICGADGFCHFTHQDSDSVSGYYLGGCTDPKFTATACPQHCTDYPSRDVVYNATNGLWVSLTDIWPVEVRIRSLSDIC